MAAQFEILMHRLSILAEPMRLDILAVISSSGTCCASDILAHFDITQPTLSHHMSVLIENEIVTAVKSGRFMQYSINKKAVGELKQVLDALCEDNVAVAPPVKTENASEDKNRKKKKKSEKKKKDKKKKK